AGRAGTPGRLFNEASSPTAPSGHGAVALLVLLARAARAGRVAGNLAAHGLGPGGLVGLPPAGHHSLRPRPGRLILADQLDPEDVAHELLPDALRELLEHVEGLAPVLGEGVALAVRPQMDALLEVVHLVEVLAPL